MVRFSALVLVLAFPAQAEIFKWVDQDGNVHYGDKPVENSQQLQISEESESAAGLSMEERRERRNKLLQAFDEDREQQNKQKAREKKQKERMQRNCLYARDRLKNYQKAGRLYRLDKDGNRVILSDAERQGSTERLKAEIKKYCK